MTLPFGANFGLLISFDQAKVSQHLKVPLSDSFSDQLHTCLLPERVGSHQLGVFLLINTTIVTCLAPSRDLLCPNQERRSSSHEAVTRNPEDRSKGCFGHLSQTVDYIS